MNKSLYGVQELKVQTFVTELRNDKLPSKDHPDYDDKVKRNASINFQ